MNPRLSREYILDRNNDARDFLTTIVMGLLAAILFILLFKLAVYAVINDAVGDALAADRKAHPAPAVQTQQPQAQTKEEKPAAQPQPQTPVIIIIVPQPHAQQQLPTTNPQPQTVPSYQGQLNAWINDYYGSSSNDVYTVQITGLTPYTTFDVQERPINGSYGNNGGYGGKADYNGNATYTWIIPPSYSDQAIPVQVLRIIDNTNAASVEVWPSMK